jgi:hypothetical protein
MVFREDSKINKLKESFMRSLIVVLLLAVFALIAGCGGALSGFMEPTADNTMIVVGRAIIEDNYYSQETGVYKQDLEIAILGKTDEGKVLGLWTSTDENGYFAIADVPKGEYVLKGVRTLIGRGSQITITNRLRLSSDQYMVTSKPTVIFNGQYFPFEATGRVLCLQQNIFTLDRMSSQTGQVNYKLKHSLQNVELVNGETLNDGPVEKHFMEKYPDTAWQSALDESSKIMRFRR